MQFVLRKSHESVQTRIIIIIIIIIIIDKNAKRNKTK